MAALGSLSLAAWSSAAFVVESVVDRFADPLIAEISAVRHAAELTELNSSTIF